jgi:hypothetical protein
MEQRTSMKFCFKMGKTATEAFQLLKQAYGGNALFLVHGFLIGTQYFERAMKILKMMECSGQPTAGRTPEMVETVHELISTDR